MAQTIIANPHFRPGTATETKEVVFRLREGALGDYLCWLSAIKYIAEEYNYVHGILVSPMWFHQVSQNVLKPFTHWKCFADKIPDKYLDGYPIRVPTIHPLNATMMHLVDLGFVYFAGLNPPPEGRDFYPKLDLSKIKVPYMIRNTKYVVFTPGATSKTRTMPAHIFNEIVAFVNGIGLTPVFLGVSSMSNGARNISFEADYNLNAGVSLINKTTILEAAKIMEEAQCVVGLDNGLLHLAATTDVPIVFGYSMVGPKHRRPRRPEGFIYDVTPDKKKLPCTFCQEQVRFFLDHDFENCIYQDFECLKSVSSEKYIEGIKEALKYAARKSRVTV